MAKYQYHYGDKPLKGYTIQRAVGRGGFGEVYYATSDTGRQVALKAVQTYEQIELRGIQQCMNLKSPHLVSVFDARYNDEGKLFVIMEYVSGPSLGDLIQASPQGLGVQKTAFFLREIAKGLQFLHDSGIVHRDLKPGNIFYENGQVKIGDYGLSKVINTSRYSNQTITVGTVHYMAPEIGVGKYDCSIDIYALGVMLYEMLTGQLPYIGASPAEVLMKHMSATPDLTGVDATFARVIKKAMARDPQDRYHTVREMVEDVFGAEQIQQSMSNFSQLELSMVAQKVAENIQKQPSPPQSSNDRKRGIKNKSEKLYDKVEKIHSYFYPENTDEIKAAAAKDPLKKKQRILLALFISALLSFAAGLFIEGPDFDDAIPVTILTFLMILGGSAGILLSRFKLLCEVESKAFRKIAAVAVAILLAALVSSFMWADAPSDFQQYMKGTLIALITLIIPNWWKLTNVGRKERVSLVPGIICAAVAFGMASAFHGQPILSIAVAAGICLYVQILCPFSGAQPVPAVKKETPKPAPVAVPKPVANIPAGTSPSSRSFAAVLCGIALIPIIPIAGLHRFYVGKIGTGLLWMFTFGLFGIGQIFDFIMILAGEFKDKHGRKLVSWDGQRLASRKSHQRPVATAIHSQQAAEPNAGRTDSPQPQPQKQDVAVKTAADPRTTTIVIEDPSAKAGVLNILTAFFGYLLFIIALLTLIATAIHLPAILAACLPDDIPMEIEQFWGTPNWPAAIEGIVVIVSLFLLAIATVFILIARRRFGAAHILRFLFAIGCIALGMVIIFETSSHITFNGTLAGQPIGVRFEQISQAIHGEAFASLVFFIPAIILLVWPPKRKPPQVVMSNSEVKIQKY